MSTLTDFMTDIADALREKKQTTEPIPAQSFKQEIRDLNTVEIADGTEGTLYMQKEENGIPVIGYTKRTEYREPSVTRLRSENPTQVISLQDGRVASLYIGDVYFYSDNMELISKVEGFANTNYIFHDNDSIYCIKNDYLTKVDSEYNVTNTKWDYGSPKNVIFDCTTNKIYFPKSSSTGYFIYAMNCNEDELNVEYLTTISTTNHSVRTFLIDDGYLYVGLENFSTNNCAEICKINIATGKLIYRAMSPNEEYAKGYVENLCMDDEKNIYFMGLNTFVKCTNDMVKIYCNDLELKASSNENRGLVFGDHVYLFSCVLNSYGRTHIIDKIDGTLKGGVNFNGGRYPQIVGRYVWGQYFERMRINTKLEHAAIYKTEE